MGAQPTSSLTQHLWRALGASRAQRCPDIVHRGKRQCRCLHAGQGTAHLWRASSAAGVAQPAGGVLIHGLPLKPRQVARLRRGRMRGEQNEEVWCATQPRQAALCWMGGFTLKGHQVACEVWRSHANMLRNAKKGCSAWHHHTRAHLFLKKVLVTQRLLQPTLLGHVPLVCGRCV